MVRFTHRDGSPSAGSRPRPIRRTVSAALFTLAVCSLALTACAPSSHPDAVARTATAATPVRSPFSALPKVASLDLRSDSIRDGRPLPKAQWSTSSELAAAQNLSPQLSWSAAPAQTRSYVVTMYDADSPILGGAIQWLLVDVPASSHQLAEGVGPPGRPPLPPGAVEFATAVGAGGYIGGNPEPRSGAHRYYFTVWALDVPSIPTTDIENMSTVNRTLFADTIARSSIVCPTSP